MRRADRSGTVRLGHDAASRLTVDQPGHAARSAALVRDAWQPTAGATGNRHRVRLAAGRRDRRSRTALLPASPRRPARGRRDRPHPRPARARRPPGAPSTCRARCASLPPFESRKHLPSRLARLRELDGRSAVRVRGAGHRVRLAARVRPRRRRPLHRLARSAPATATSWSAPGSPSATAASCSCSTPRAPRPAASSDVPRLDSAMDAALLLAALAARAGDRVDFLAGDRQVRARLRAAGAARHRGDAAGRDGRPRAGDRRGRLGRARRRGQPPRTPARARRAAHPARAARRSRRACSRCCRP